MHTMQTNGSELIRDQIAQIDATSRTRALTDQETRRLERLIYRERYVAYRQRNRCGA